MSALFQKISSALFIFILAIQKAPLCAVPDNITVPLKRKGSVVLANITGAIKYKSL